VADSVGADVFRKGSAMAPRISVVAATRPNFMKVAPVVAALAPRCDVELVHTGQHYDRRMSDSFFDDLGIPDPDVNLGIGSGTHAEQTGQVMAAYERHLLDRRPSAVVVVGDVNSTLAATLAAVKLHVPVAHVEAGLRSGDREMPEEINRVLTDAVSRWLFTTSADADEHLAAEGIAPDRVHLVGNVMIDSLVAHLDDARGRGDRLRDDLGVASGQYAVMTLHRPSNVDDPATLRGLLAALGAVAAEVPLVFPVHPRTARRLADFDLALPDGVVAIEPLGYLDFIGLVDGAVAVLTDSGGIQEETSVLGVACVTMRTSTERPVTITHGTNRLVGVDPDAVRTAGLAALDAPRRPAAIPLWDGHAADRIADVLAAEVADATV
jgi:UDP-N-acetylglucosamine 2-epimerase (non-hydrolysing)